MEKEKIDGDEFEAIYVANTTAEQRAADPDNPARNDRNKPQAHSRQPGVDFSPEPPEYDNAEQGEGM